MAKNVRRLPGAPACRHYRKKAEGESAACKCGARLKPREGRLGFHYRPAFLLSVQLTFKLHMETDSDGEAADAIRDMMDAPYRELSHRERAFVGIFSEMLYMAKGDLPYDLAS